MMWLRCALRGTSACAMANKASRDPLTGSTMRSGSTALPGSLKRLHSQREIVARISSVPLVAGYFAVVDSAAVSAS